MKRPLAAHPLRPTALARVLLSVLPAAGFGLPAAAQPHSVASDAALAEAYGWAIRTWPLLQPEIQMARAQFVVAACLARSGAPDVALAPQDEASGRTQGGLTYRAACLLLVSGDGGRQWAPLAPQCTLQVPSRTGAMAIDAARPEHVITAVNRPSADMAATGEAAADASVSCHVAPACGVRTIAYTHDVRPQVAASLAAFTGAAGDPASRARTTPAPSAIYSVQAAGHGWRYSSLVHLAAPVRKWLGKRWQQSVCRMDVQAADPQLRMVPSPTCTAQPSSVCHGSKVTHHPTLAGQQWCPDMHSPDCHCKDLSTPPTAAAWNSASPPGFCHYPAVRSLEIDPRNGFAYASTLVGLLTSPDGGGKWQRFGNGRVQDCAASGGTASHVPVKDPNPYLPVQDGAGHEVAWPPPNDPGKPQAARLLTHQGVPMCGPAGSQRTDSNAFDLNAWPQYIAHVGRMVLSFQPCQDARGQAKFYTDLPTRKRGTLTATLPVAWRARHPATAPGSGEPLAAVLVAHEPDDCTGERAAPGALTLRDPAVLWRVAAQRP